MESISDNYEFISKNETLKTLDDEIRQQTEIFIKPISESPLVKSRKNIKDDIDYGTINKKLNIISSKKEKEQVEENNLIILFMLILLIIFFFIMWYFTFMMKISRFHNNHIVNFTKHSSFKQMSLEP